MRGLIRSARLVALIVLLSLIHAVAQQPAPASQAKRKFVMWKVSSPTATVYLVGSMHLLKKDAYPLPAPVEAAFKEAKILAVEINTANMDQAKMGALVQQYGLYAGDDSLSKHIRKETAAALDEFCAAYGLPRANLERMKPWLISTLVAIVPFQKAGADPNSGVDMHFLKQTSAQRIDELETPEFQLTLLASGTDEEQDTSLAYALKNIDEIKLLEADYLAGDMDAVMRRVNASPSKAMTERLLDGRNPKMTEKVEAYLKGTEPVFVVVGAAHVIGEKGIARALESKKYKVEKLTYDW